MHIPDGFLNAPTCVFGGVIAAGLVTLSVRRAGTDLDDRRVPLAGLVAAFVFAVQMLNFPVAGGTSGHLLGGCLAAVLVGPWVAGLVMTVVFAIQALVFADGGLTALGVNILLMGYTTCFVGYGVTVLVRRLLPRNRLGVTIGAGIGAWTGVVAASLLFGVLYTIGGPNDIASGTVTVAMVAVHAVIGAGEAAITATTVSAVLAVRPDLVHGARWLGARPPTRSTAVVRIGGSR